MNSFLWTVAALLSVLTVVAGVVAVLLGGFTWLGGVGLALLAVGGAGLMIARRHTGEATATSAPDADGRIRSKQAPEKSNERRGPRPGQRL